jgi:hypothetical protein
MVVKNEGETIARVHLATIPYVADARVSRL